MLSATSAPIRRASRLPTPSWGRSPSGPTIFTASGTTPSHHPSSTLFDGWPLALLLVLATMTGAVLAAVVGSRPGGLPISVSGGLLLGLLTWIAWSLTVEPLLRGQGPTWSAAAAGETLRQLVGDVVQGGLTGATLHGLLSVRARSGARAAALPFPERSVPRVVI